MFRSFQNVVFVTALAAVLVGYVARDLLAASNPIGDIADDMYLVTGKLSKQETGKPTQETQKEVINKLDALIAILEKECEACRGQCGASANPTRPLADSQIVGGPGGIGELLSPKQSGRKWGELPPHQRDRIMQSLTDGFPAHYQQILERYYKRLASEEAVVEEGPAAGSNPPAESTGQSPPSDPTTDEPAAMPKDSTIQPSADEAGQ